MLKVNTRGSKNIVLEYNSAFSTNSDFQIRNPYNFATQCCRSKIILSMNYVGSIHLGLKYQRFTPLGCKDIGIRKFWVCDQDSIPFSFLFSVMRGRISFGLNCMRIKNLTHELSCKEEGRRNRKRTLNLIKEFSLGNLK